jgi:hypothetical protein
MDGTALEHRVSATIQPYHEKAMGLALRIGVLADDGFSSITFLGRRGETLFNEPVPFNRSEDDFHVTGV